MNEAGSRMKKLLNNVAELSKAREVIYRVTGEKFNIFSILNIGGREFFICKVLKELLSPSGSHCQGILFLRPFVKNVLRLNIPDTELAGARVYSEHYTFQGRYIDIVIETANYFIAIEVKITAKDLNRQCIDYYEEAKHRCADENNAKIIYITPDGRKPSSESACGKEICVSFGKDIHEWLSSCLNFKEIEYAVSVREIIRQFLMTIENFTGRAKETNTNMEVKELILSSPENLRAAFELQSGFVYEVVEDMRKRFLEAVNEKLKSWNITHGTFKDEKGNDLPHWHALQYKYDKMPNVIVCLGNDEHGTYVSYYVTGHNETNLADFVRKIKECVEKFNSGSQFKDYLYYEYYNVGDKGSPNFWTENSKSVINEATFELCDPETFDSFVELCAGKIKDFLEFSPE